MPNVLCDLPWLSKLVANYQYFDRPERMPAKHVDAFGYQMFCAVLFWARFGCRSDVAALLDPAYLQLFSIIQLLT